jgi:hypothetical protein
LHKGIITAVKKVEFVSGRMSHMILRGCWCDRIVLNVHAPTEDKIDDIKDRSNFYVNNYITISSVYLKIKKKIA